MNKKYAPISYEKTILCSFPSTLDWPTIDAAIGSRMGKVLVVRHCDMGIDILYVFYDADRPQQTVDSKHVFCCFVLRFLLLFFMCCVVYCFCVCLPLFRRFLAFVSAFLIFLCFGILFAARNLFGTTSL